MAFVPIDVRIPRSADIVRAARSHTLDCLIASDPNEDRLLFVSCQLYFVDADFTSEIPEAYFEFSYEVAVVDQIDPDRSFATQDRYEVRRLISDGIAQTLRKTVIAACRVLVEEVRPPLVYRVTKVRNPPEKALQKHNEITDVLINMGYRVIIRDFDKFVRVYWLMRYSPDSGHPGR